MYIIRRIQCKSGNVSETHLVEIETDDIEATRKELHDCYQCDKILFNYDEQWVETRITLRWLTPIVGGYFELRSYKAIRFVRCARRTIAVHLQPKYITVPVESVSHELGMRQLMFDYNNLQSLCHSCHSDVHRRAFSHSKEVIQANNRRATERFVEKFLK